MPERSPPSATRRAVVAAGAAAVAATAGCAALTDDDADATLDVVVFNDTDSPFTVELSLFSVGGGQSRSEARAYAASLDVDPGGETRREDVAAARQYVVRYDVYRENTEPTDSDHVHFYPSGDGDDTLAFDVRAPGVLDRRP